MYDFVISCQDAVSFLTSLENDSLDLTVTSPPYDDMRTYDGFSSDFNEGVWKNVLKELYRKTKKGGNVVWIVGDQTKNGSETLTSFRQAIYAVEDCGFRLNDTMIWNKGCFSSVGNLQSRYAQVFEYMFVFSKDRGVFNPLKDRENKRYGEKKSGSIRKVDGNFRNMSNVGKTIKKNGIRFNVWEQIPEKNRTLKHPAKFPVALARDHILSWSNEGDLVCDPFLGSGTTAVAALESQRRFIGCDVNPKYVEMSKTRLLKHL